MALGRPLVSILHSRITAPGVAQRGAEQRADTRQVRKVRQSVLQAHALSRARDEQHGGASRAAHRARAAADTVCCHRICQAAQLRALAITIVNKKIERVVRRSWARRAGGATQCQPGDIIPRRDGQRRRAAVSSGEGRLQASACGKPEQLLIAAAQRKCGVWALQRGS
jgi:hypothetical protein